MYAHLTREQRVALATLLKAGYSQRKAAKEIGISQSTLCRELGRNAREDGWYHPLHTEVRSRRRRRASKIGERKIENNPALAARIEQQLHPLVSPEVIAHDEEICHDTIYEWIARSRPDLKNQLPQRGKKRRRYGSKRAQKQGWTRDVRSIRERPPGAEHRSRTRHFEGDTLRGKRGALLTLTDRKSRYEAVAKMPGEYCDDAHLAMVARKEKLSARSFTFDRGSVFSLWRMVERDMNAKVYFADPHAPWQRGTNENANGRLRCVFPKGTDFSIISQRDIDRVVRLMNHTKRKCLHWRTPAEVFGE